MALETIGSAAVEWFLRKAASTTFTKEERDRCPEIRADLIEKILGAASNVLSRKELEKISTSVLLHCYRVVKPSTLNPKKSINFLEAELPLDERTARIELFAERIIELRNKKIIVELIETLLLEDESRKVNQEIIGDLRMIISEFSGRAIKWVEAEARKPRDRGKIGAERSNAPWKETSNEAVRLARELGLDDGSLSAAKVAELIEDRVVDFARRNGRPFFGGDRRRTIAGYLRKAGIKQCKKPST